MKKKVLGVLLSAAMVVGLLGGCGAPGAVLFLTGLTALDTMEKSPIF